MAELVACFILATWLLDAFNVVGYLWPSGERGSGLPLPRILEPPPDDSNPSHTW